MIYEFASADNIGDRKDQQDRVATLSHPSSADVVLAVLTDGMGGHTGGALAAQSVIDAITPLFGTYTPGTMSADQWLKDMIMAAHHKVAAAGQGYNRDPRATCVLALAQPGRIDWVHCGDSRLYLFRDGDFVSRSEDHSLVEILLQQGKITDAEVHTHPERSKVFSSLGGPEPPQIATGFIDKVAPGDTVLLASDGLWAYFKPREIADVIAFRNLTSSCDNLIKLARHRARGNGDNLSVAMIRQPVEPAKPGLIGSLFGLRSAEPSPLDGARRFILSQLRQHAAQHANGLIEQIKQSPSLGELVTAVPQCVKALSAGSGAEVAESFLLRVQGLLEEA